MITSIEYTTPSPDEPGQIKYTVILPIIDTGQKFPSDNEAADIEISERSRKLSKELTESLLQDINPKT